MLIVFVGARSAGVAAAVLAVLLALAPTAAAQIPPRVAGVTIIGVDLHDGMMLEAQGVFHLYGTMYGCGYEWGHASPWCGFGVSSASSPAGPWSTPRQLFLPTDVGPVDGLTWQQNCGDSGAGCFNPRMVQRSGWGTDDGAWILWFNAPADFNRSHANAYYAMECAGPMGPCGDAVKPSMFDCTENGDFSIVRDDPRPPMMLCTMADQTLASERLTPTGMGGAGGGKHKLAGLSRTEAPGAYRDARTGKWIMTYNDPNCGYCAGTPTSYATAPAVDAEWTAPTNTNPAWGAQPLGRRGISATSCGGQGRTVITLRGHAYQLIDLWLGTANEATAGIRLEPLVYHGDSPLGQPLRAFDAWTCEPDVRK